jgi:hypothetical protein
MASTGVLVEAGADPVMNPGDSWYVIQGFMAIVRQPQGYLRYLLRDDAPERWLIFLVPKAWFHLCT